MENHKFILKKVSWLFPASLTSSCHLHVLPDVSESSTTFPNKTFHENHLKKTHEKVRKKNFTFPNNPSDDGVLKNSIRDVNTKIGTPLSSVNNQSSSATSGWFSSSNEKTRPYAETDTFFSFSSNSGGSFQLSSSRSFRKCEEMKRINETGRCSFSSVASFNPVLRRQNSKILNQNVVHKMKGLKSSKVYPEYELGSDQMSAEIYYSKMSSDSGASCRRRKAKNGRKCIDKNGSTTIEESYAVQKSSSDPYGDFRASMVEMIVEKQMFGADDLNKLLFCFLNLNTVSYHAMIVDVFYEICETLLSSSNSV